MHGVVAVAACPPGNCMQGYAWAEDKEHCEEYGRLLSADPTKVSQRAKKRGLSQVAPSFMLKESPVTKGCMEMNIWCWELAGLMALGLP